MLTLKKPLALISNHTKINIPLTIQTLQSYYQIGKYKYVFELFVTMYSYYVLVRDKLFLLGSVAIIVRNYLDNSTHTWKILDTVNVCVKLWCDAIKWKLLPNQQKAWASTTNHIWTFNYYISHHILYIYMITTFLTNIFQQTQILNHHYHTIPDH